VRDAPGEGAYRLQLLRFAEPSLEQLRLGHVTPYHDETRGFPRPVDDGRDGGFHLELGAVLFPGHEVSLPRLALRNHFPYHLEQSLVLFVAFQYPGVPADYFLAAVTGVRLESGIHVAYYTLLVRHYHGLGGMVDGGGEEAELFLGGFALGDVYADRLVLGDFPVFVEQGPVGPLHPPDVAVAVIDLVFIGYYRFLGIQGEVLVPDFFAVLLGYELEEVLSFQVLFSVPEIALVGIVHEGQGAVGTEAAYHDRHLLHEFPVPRLAFPEFLFYLLTLGDFLLEFGDDSLLVALEEDEGLDGCAFFLCRASGPGLFENLVQFFDEQFRFDGLVYEEIHPHVHRELFVLLRDEVRRIEDEGDVFESLVPLAFVEQFETVHLGHHYVRDDDVRPPGDGVFNGLGSVRRRDYLVTVILQNLPKDTPALFIVVHYQYFHDITTACAILLFPDPVDCASPGLEMISRRGKHLSDGFSFSSSGKPVPVGGTVRSGGSRRLHLH